MKTIEKEIQKCKKCSNLKKLKCNTISYGKNNDILFIGVSNKKNEGMKMSILISVTMLLSFLSGMMVLKMKYIIAENVPILAKINPVNMVTDGLYSLYYYNTLD